MTELQLEFVRKFGRNELSFGCQVRLFENSPAVEYFYVCESDFSWHTIFIKTGLGGYEDCTTDYEDDEFEILWHPVEWHDVFAKLKEEDIAAHISFDSKLSSELKVYRNNKEWIVKIPCNPCESPMEQPELIEQLLLLIK